MFWILCGHSAVRDWLPDPLLLLCRSDRIIGGKMKIKNSTPYPTHYLRRLTSWTCKQLGLPIKDVREVVFRNRSDKWFSGLSYSTTGRIICSIPTVVNECRIGTGKRAVAISDKTEGIVWMTAHEAAHRLQKVLARDGRKLSANKERDADAKAYIVLKRFRENRAELEAAWNKSLATRIASTHAPTLQEKRAAKARQMLLQWERKARLAKTKVAKYRKQARYYDKALAAKRAPKDVK